MPIEILMPALSPTMTEGKVANWNVKEGDTVQSGDIIAEVETDKATMEIEAVDEGTIGKILIEAGAENVPVNTPMAILLEEGEDASAMDAMSKAAPVSAPSADAAPVVAPAPAVSPASGDSSAAAAGLMMGFGGFDLEAPAGRVFASPLARRIAKDAGLDLNLVKGSGPRGRIVRADVDKAIASGVQDEVDADLEAAMAMAMGVKPPSDKPAAPKPTASAIAGDYGTPYTEVPHSGMRKVIASRLTESKQTVPHFYVTMDVTLDALLALRSQINERAAKTGGAKISVNDFIIRASAIALENVPEANVSWTDNAMRQYSRPDVSIAVATPAGLITPIVRNAADKSLGNISKEMKALAGKARDGKLMPEEYQGGTFSISNLGMFGVKEFSAILNPPQSMILAVGTSEQRPVVKDGAINIATMMTLTLSCDHRCIDGALGAKFIGELKVILEDPFSILL